MQYNTDIYSAINYWDKQCNTNWDKQCSTLLIKIVKYIPEIYSAIQHWDKKYNILYYTSAQCAGQFKYVHFSILKFGSIQSISSRYSTIVYRTLLKFSLDNSLQLSREGSNQYRVNSSAPTSVHPGIFDCTAPQEVIAIKETIKRKNLSKHGKFPNWGEGSKSNRKVFGVFHNQKTGRTLSALKNIFT